MRVLAYNEGKFIVSKDLTAESVKDKVVSINIAPVMNYRDEDDVVGAQLDIDFSVDEKTVLFFGMVVSIYVENVKELLKETDEAKIKHELIPLWDVALGIARGVLAEKTKGTPLEHQFLPMVDLEKFAEVVALVKEKAAHSLE